MTNNQKSKGDKIVPGLAWCVARCRAMASMVLSVTLAMAVTGCDAREAAPKTPASEFAAPREPVGLTIYGYNYTNRYIDQFYVNGNAGSNLGVSTPTAGGSKTVCCFSYTPGTPAPKTVKVKWQHGACKYKETKESTYAYTHPFFKTLDVPVDPNVPANPSYFEVHFYPDGHVEAAITEHSSPPRLILSEDREDRSDYPRCPDDQKPKE